MEDFNFWQLLGFSGQAAISQKAQSQDDLYGAALYNQIQGKDFNLPISFKPLTISEKTQLETAKNTAKVTGDINWEKTADFVLKYGTQVLGVLSAIGVIKNKNIQSVANGEIDSEKFDELVAKGRSYNGSGTPDSNNTVKVFGIELTPINLIILIVAIVFLYKTFVADSGTKRK